MPIVALIAALHLLAAARPKPVHLVGRDVSPEYRHERLRWLATHEGGHTIAAWCCPFVGTVQNVSVKPASGNGPVLWNGVTNHDWIVERGTPEYLWWDMIISLAGLAAEVATYGKIVTLPPRKDIDDALTSVRTLCKTNGCFTGYAPPIPLHVPCTAAESAALGYAWNKATEILAAHCSAHATLTEALIADRALSSADLTAILGPRGPS